MPNAAGTYPFVLRARGVPPGRVASLLAFTAGRTPRPAAVKASELVEELSLARVARAPAALDDSLLEWLLTG